MNQEWETNLAAIRQETNDLVDQVERALDEYSEQSMMLATRARVDDLARRYREFLAAIEDEKDRDEVDRTLGRQVGDLQKLAATLPAPPVGKPVELAHDDEFMATRAPTSSRPPVNPGADAPPRGDVVPRYRVATEVESWCGPCATITTHVIAAIVNDLPAKVVCQACGSRHNYRAISPIKAKKPPSSPGIQVTKDVHQDKRARERAILLDELQQAANVRAYSPRERFRSGEVMEHPEHGRGKVESVLPRSLLVRFAGGLKSVKRS
ncbi:MAG: hypothetical protein V2A73_19320 [Pseudomonadota bacterium]